MHRFRIIEPQNDESGMPRYMQYRLSLQGWHTLEEDLFSPIINTTEGDKINKKDEVINSVQRRRYLPSVLWTEADWIGCFGTDDVIDNFYRTNQWNMLLIGEVGTGIFFHHDHLAAASWSAQVVGRKEWIICPFNQSYLLNNDIFTFSPDYNHSPQFADALCGRTIVKAGELLYYPAYWWHQTKCLDRPTIGITGLMVGIEHDRKDIAQLSKTQTENDGLVHLKFLRDMQLKCSNCWPKDLAQCHGDFKSCRKCEDISMKWPGAAPPVAHQMCAALPKCYALWDKHYRGLNVTTHADSMKQEL